MTFKKVFARGSVGGQREMTIGRIVENVTKKYKKINISTLV